MGQYCIPIELLSLTPAPNSNEKLQSETLSQLENIMNNNGISCKAVASSMGPKALQFEFTLAAGTRLSVLKAKAKNIAEHLGVDNIIVTPVYEKTSTVRISIPQSNRFSNGLRTALETTEFETQKLLDSFILGCNECGKTVVESLSKIQNLFITGTTGTGKTTFLFAMLVSLLYKVTSEDLKLILIDTSKISFTLFNGIPHLLCPVITDEQESVNIFEWLHIEMEKRFKLLSMCGARTIEQYNDIQTSIQNSRMPKILVIVDELNDIVSTNNSDIGEELYSLLRKGPFVGIHLVLSAQYIDYATIKKYILPYTSSKISFASAPKGIGPYTKRIPGYKELSAPGEMLFLPNRSTTPEWLQSYYISPKEINSIVTYLQEQASELSKIH